MCLRSKKDAIMSYDSDVLLRLPQVLAVIPYKKSRFFQLVREGKLPAPVKLPGGRASAWPKSQIDALVSRLVNGQGVPHA